MLPKLPALKKVFQDRDLRAKNILERLLLQHTNIPPTKFTDPPKIKIFTVMLQTQLKSLKESCTSLKWGDPSKCCRRKSSRAGTGQGFKAEALTVPDVKNALEMIRNKS